MHTRQTACRRSVDSHTGDAIAAMYNAIVTDYGIANTLTAIVTNNAANMVKGFRQPEVPELETDIEGADFVQQAID